MTVLLSGTNGIDFSTGTLTYPDDTTAATATIDFPTSAPTSVGSMNSTSTSTIVKDNVSIPNGATILVITGTSNTVDRTAAIYASGGNTNLQASGTDIVLWTNDTGSAFNARLSFDIGATQGYYMIWNEV